MPEPKPERETLTSYTERMLRVSRKDAIEAMRRACDRSSELSSGLRKRGLHKIAEEYEAWVEQLKEQVDRWDKEHEQDRDL